MTRTVTSGIAAATVAVASQPGYLIQIDLPAPPSGPGSLYRCTFDVDFTYNNIRWTADDIIVEGMNWSTTNTQNGRITFGDPDAVWWQIAAGGPTSSPMLQDAAISIYQAYAEAPNEAVPLWKGRIGQVARGPMTVVCNVRSDTATTYCPRRRVQSVVPIGYLVPPGKIIMIGNQKWVLGRKLNG